MEEPKTKTAEV
jgi:hypothetical protein